MKKVVFIFIIVIIVCGVIFFAFKNLKIKNITCASQYGGCNSRLVSQISAVKNKNIIDARAELNKILKNDSSILDYSINFILPNNFKVNVIERKAIAAFLLKDGGYQLVDSEGNILTEVKTTTLPRITTSISLDHAKIVFISNLINRLHFLYNVNSASVTADGVIFDNIYGKKVIFPLSGDIDVLLGSLILIISRLPSVKEASTISVVDLRYKNPVLR